MADETQFTEVFKRTRELSKQFFQQVGYPNDCKPEYVEMIMTGMFSDTYISYRGLGLTHEDALKKLEESVHVRIAIFRSKEMELI